MIVRHRRRLPGLVAGLGAVAVLSGCAGEVARSTQTAPRTSAPVEVQSSEGTSTAPATPEATTPEPTGPEPSDGRANDARLSIPELGIADLEVQTYVGVTDDAAGHAIQNTGIVASPTGPDGGTGPGGVGNYQVTGHRTSSTRIFEFLPDLQRGDRMQVRSGGTVYVYEVVDTRITSFRSERSLREQRAAVPGKPGAEPTRAMITISTCRTQEDHAEGNYWSDEFDNPENRIDKIGVLVNTRPAR